MSLADSPGQGATQGHAGFLRNPPNPQERSRKRGSSREHSVLSLLSTRPADAPIPGGGSWCCRGCRRGGGDTQSWPSSRASCDRPSRVQTPGPYPTPGQESREELAHPKTGAKVRRKLPLTSPGSHPWSRPWGSWTDPQLPTGTAGVGHKDTCPRGRAWPGLLPLQRAVCRPGPARGRRARGGHGALGCIGARGSSPSRPLCYPPHHRPDAPQRRTREGPVRWSAGGHEAGLHQILPEADLPTKPTWPSPGCPPHRLWTRPLGAPWKSGPQGWGPQIKRAEPSR